MTDEATIFHVLEKVGGPFGHLRWVGRVQAPDPKQALALALAMPEVEPGSRVELAGFPEKFGYTPVAVVQRRAA